MGPSLRLILGDARTLPELPDASVELVVTSPPYWTLKDYDVGGQIGFRQTLEAYLDDLGRVFGECVRALRPGCRLCINIGDQFARAKTFGRYRVIPLHAGITARVESLGADFMGSIIWRKVTTCNTTGGGAVMGSFPYPRNGIVKLDYEHILLFRKPGDAPAPSAAIRDAAKLTTAEWNTFFAGHWEFPGARAVDHIAPFPAELPRRLIRMFTFPGETVLDPFVGSGTTMRAASELGRSAIGVDIDARSEALVRAALDDGACALPFAGAALEVVRREGEAGVAEVAGDAEPIEDPAGAARPFYGSVVAPADRGRRRFDAREARCDHVTGPNAFVTRDGLAVELLGTTPLPGRERAASERLAELLAGERLLLTDRNRAALADGDRRGYVHLANRTFVNGRLVREGLLAADVTDPTHPHHARFMAAEAAARGPGAPPRRRMR